MGQRETCRHGHPLTAENVYIQPKTGYRSCRICTRDAIRRYQRRKKGIDAPRTCECGRKLNGRKRTCAPCRSQRSDSYHITDADRAWIYQRDGHQCLKCESTENLTVDHVLPRALGGADHRSNYQTLCTACNSSKGATYADYRRGSTGQLSLVLTLPKKTLRDRFMEKVDRRADGCWDWTGARTSAGTPVMNVNGQLVTAARVSFQLHGDIDESLQVYRTCAMAGCVAPDHLTQDAREASRKRQETCRNGHSDDFRMDKDGSRRCMTCRRESQNAWYAKKKEQALAS